MRAGVIFRLVSAALQDIDPDAPPRWPDCDLVDFLNSAVRSIVLQRPDLCAVTETIRLEPGMRQRLPVSRKHGPAAMLIDIVRNMDGDCPGPAILPVNMNLLMAWASSCASSTTIENWAHDRSVNPHFYLVYPAVPDCADVYVEATFSVSPCPVMDSEDEIPLPDDYAPALEHHILASILAGDNDSSNYSKAVYHMQLFNSLLGLKTGVDMSWPKAKNSGAA